MQNISNIFKSIEQLKVLVLGDVMLDKYFVGNVNRMSPEAPVPVVDIESMDTRLGGAANVVLNIQALKATPILCAVIGNDANGDLFEKLAHQENIDVKGLVKSKTRKTTSKTRVISDDKQMLRYDIEDKHDLDEEEEQMLLDKVKEIVNSEKIDVLIFQDYNKGVLINRIIKNVVTLAQENNILTVVDPKKDNFWSYQGVDLFKPNLKELSEALNQAVNPKDVKALDHAEQDLRSRLNNKITFVTLSENGVYIKAEGEGRKYAAYRRDIKDVSGAGDTVISMAALVLGVTNDEETIARLSNLAGGLVCESVGVVPINLDRLIDEAKSI